jgi:hypothetical protein
MNSVRLELSEAQVIALVHQLSPGGKQAVLRMLVPELGELDELDDLEAIGDYDEDIELWEETDEFGETGAFWDEEGGMTRRQLLAAETFNYSYANYADHLGVNIRFDELMPNDVDVLEQAEREGWDDAELAEALEVEASQAPHWRESYRRAKLIIDAPTPAESFRHGVRFSVQNALEKQEKGKLTGDKLVERIVGQVCYRAADLAYLLDMRNERLSQYSSALREESGVGWEDFRVDQTGESE